MRDRGWDARRAFVVVARRRDVFLAARRAEGDRAVGRRKSDDSSGRYDVSSGAERTHTPECLAYNAARKHRAPASYKK